MQPQYKNKFGRVDLNVSAFGFGTAPVGNIFKEIDEKTSDDMFQAAWKAGIRFYDTAPMYGHGLSSIGQDIPRWKNRDDFILSTKVGRLLHPAKKETINYAPWTNAGRFEVEFNYSYDATMRSVEDSLQRMGLESIDIFLYTTLIVSLVVMSSQKYSKPQWMAHGKHCRAFVIRA